jgi:hypothetical protein
MRYLTVKSFGTKIFALFVILNIASFGFFVDMLLAQSSPIKRKNIRFSPPYGLGLPKATIGAAVRSQDCDKEPSCIIPLMPEKDVNSLNYFPLTVSERPTFFFYVPKITGMGKFTLYEDLSTEPKKIYSTAFPVDVAGGIISITLPTSVPALQSDRTYQWKLILSNGSNDLEATGIFRRVQLDRKVIDEIAKSETIERAAIYAKNGIWFESIKTLLELKETNKEALNEWLELLKSVDLVKIAENRLVKCCNAEK